MKTYTFPDTSPVESIRFVTSAKGNVRAYLKARDGTSDKILQKYTDELKHDGVYCTPYSLNDQPLLEVRKFGKEHDLINELDKLGAIKGIPEITNDKNEHISPLDYVKKRSLQASGVFQMIGDYNFFRYGIKNSNMSDVAAGIFYALGTGALVGYGRNDQSNRQVKDFSDDLVAHLEKHHITVPRECSLQSITEDREKGLIQSANDFIARYPSEVYNVFTGLAGLAVANAAYRHKFKLSSSLANDAQTNKTFKQSGLLDMGLGFTTFAATTFGLLVKEKKKDPDDPPAANKIQQAWEWAQSNPLTVTGMGLMVSTLCHAVSTALDYRDAVRIGNTVAKSSILNRAAFVGNNMMAELLIIISSKGHGHGVIADESVKESVYATAAELINAQAPEHKEAAFEQVKTFLSQPTVFADSSKEVEQKLHEAIAKLQKNPWACSHSPSYEKESASQKKVTPEKETDPSPEQIPATQVEVQKTHPTPTPELHDPQIISVLTTKPEKHWQQMVQNTPPEQSVQMGG